MNVPLDLVDLSRRAGTSGLVTTTPLAELDLSAFDVEFVERCGTRRREPLERCFGRSFEDLPPVRLFSTACRVGPVSYAGFRWSATTGRHVGFESWLERDHAMLLDFDPDVIGLCSQPFWLRWHDGRRVRRHAPDYFVRCRDGSAVVVDDRVEDRDAEAFAATERACEQVGWQFRRVGEVDAVFTASVRWLGGFRHLRCRQLEVADRLLAVLDKPRTLFGVAEEAGRGNRLAALPTLFHLMWTHELVADLNACLLSPHTMIAAARGEG